MKVLHKLASSLDDAISLVLGEDTKSSVDVYIDRYPFWTVY